ncbi:MAG: NADH-quinone oxidoreductase, subunit G, partial [Nitrospinae bacterium CG11_big_fil_rev_8_21_14_0_20_56_8]
MNRSGPETVAGIGSEKLTNEENYLVQKLFRGVYGSNQLTNLQNLQAPYVNAFMIRCFENGIVSKPVTELQNADVVLVFNSDLPSEYPVGGNSIRKGAIFNKTGIIYANPRNVRFDHMSEVDVRLNYRLGSDVFLANRMCRILIDEEMVDTGKISQSVPNFTDFVQSLAAYTAEATQKATGLTDETIMRAARHFAKKADRAILIGNDVIDTSQGKEILHALLNLAVLVHFGGEGSVSLHPPREHCNSQGVNDMGVTPQFLPGYRPVTDASARQALAKEWGTADLALGGANLAEDLFQSCVLGKIKFLHIAGEDPVRFFYRGALAKDALNTVPFLVVQDSYLTETAKMADIVLPTATYAEKEGTFTNMTRHVQRVAPAILPQGKSRTDFDIFCSLAHAFGKPFSGSSVMDVQDEISRTVPIYHDVFPGTRSQQWVPTGFANKPGFEIHPFPGQPAGGREGYPLKLLTSNHMFHIGSYSQFSKSLMEISPECCAELHPSDAEAMGLKEGDRVQIDSGNFKVEAPVKINRVTAQGMVYIPKNWAQVPVNLL